MVVSEAAFSSDGGDEMIWEKMTDEQFAEAAKAKPWAAIEYAMDRVKRLGLSI